MGKCGDIFVFSPNVSQYFSQHASVSFPYEEYLRENKGLIHGKKNGIGNLKLIKKTR